MRDLRTRLFDHLLTLELGFFQRTRAGQVISGIITEVDQTKTVITASLVSLFQNLVVVAVTLVVLSQISLRLTLFTLAFVPLLVVLLQRLVRRLRRHARARAQGAGRGHRHGGRADRRDPADPLLRGGSARVGRVQDPGRPLPEAGDPHPAILLAHQPGHRGVLRVPGHPHHLGGHAVPGCSAWPRRSPRPRSSSS